MLNEIDIKKGLSRYLIDLIDHDVRAPMKNFAYFLSLLKDEELKSQNFDLTEPLQLFCNESSFLMENYVLWKRITYEYVRGSQSRTAKIFKIANEVRLNLLPYLLDKQLHISFNFDKNQMFETDRDIFRFVFKNVIYTILNYSSKGNAIFVDLLEKEKCLEIRSIDMFIPGDKINFLFSLDEYRSVRAKDIGMLLSLHLLKISKGKLFYDQNDSGESKFRLYFN